MNLTKLSMSVGCPEAARSVCSAIWSSATSYGCGSELPADLVRLLVAHRDVTREATSLVLTALDTLLRSTETVGGFARCCKPACLESSSSSSAWGRSEDMLAAEIAPSPRVRDCETPACIDSENRMDGEKYLRVRLRNARCCVAWPVCGL